MIRRRVAWAGVLAITACRPAAATQRPGDAAKPGEPAARALDVDDLGPPDAEPAPDESKPAEFQFVERGPARPFGAAARVKRRPNAPGREGELLVATDTPYQLFGRASSYVHVAAWRPDGRPAAHADVFVDRKGVGRTDANGTLVFRWKGDAIDAERAGSSMFVIDRAHRCGAVTFTPYSRTAGFASDQLYVYTDRGVFRPGETVHVRVIGWHLADDYAPIEGGEVELLLRDDGGHSLAAARPTTDEFGIASADLTVPLSADAGTYRLHVAYGQARESTELQIRAFEPPVLRIEHTLPRRIGPDRDRLAFTIDAHPVGGGELRKGEIRVEVAGPKRAHAIERAIEGAGPQRFEIGPKELAKLRTGAVDGDVLGVVVRVRDEHDREDVLVRSIALSDNPWVGVLEPDRDAYAPGDRVVVVARVSDLDDVALKHGEVRLVGLPGKPVKASTDAHGVARFDLVMPAGTTTIQLLAPEVDTPIASAELALGAVSPMQSSLSDPIVREEAKTAIAVRFPSGHVPVDRRVHMDVTDTSGALVAAAVLPAKLEGDAWIARGEFSVPTWGTAMLTLFAVGRAPKAHGPASVGLLVAGQELAVVPDRELQIELHGLPEEAAPGATLEIGARVRDAKGKPVRFAASAALVDSAVLALKDPLEVTPMDRFYDPDLRTLATTGAQMLTWPVVSRNWGDSRHDVALPPFDFEEGGEADTCRSHWDDEDIASLDPDEAEVFGTGGIGSMGTGSGGGSGMGVGMGAGRAGTSITIRTRFPDTSLWVPDLRGDGEAKFRARLPDRMGEQELVVVASDRRGGVGIARERVKVTQAMFVEADLPDVAIAGERVEIPVVVHNGTKADDTFGLSLATEAGSPRRASVRASAGASAAALLELAPTAAGRTAVTIAADGGGRRDVAKEDVDVVPRGVAVTGAIAATAKRDRTLELVVDVPKDAARVDAHLRLALPVATSAMLPIDDLFERIADDPYAIAADLASAGALLELADRRGLASPKLDRLRTDARAAVAMLARMQRDDGTFAYWRNGRSSPYVTAIALDAMLAARRADLPVPTKTMRAAADALGRALRKGELLQTREIGWWEGTETTVREGITAEAFAVLARVPFDQRGPDVEAALAALARRYAAIVEDDAGDVRTTASAITALLELGRLEPSRARKSIDRLVRLRDQGHWEPTWFSAFGGRIEATTAMIDAMQALDPSGYAIEIRDAMRWLLSTSPSWGEWHNERGTAAALRCLAGLATPSGALPRAIEVRVDGKRVRDVTIDERDPLGSVLALGRLDVGSWSAGRHVVEVRWADGAAPVASLVTRTWQGARASTAAGAGAQLRAPAPGSVRLGDEATLAVELSGKHLGGATLRLARSGLVELDMVRLGARIGRGRPIADVRVREDAIELRLGPDARSGTFELPIRAVRRGSGRWPAIALVVRPRAIKASARGPIVVDPGPLAVR